MRYLVSIGTESVECPDVDDAMREIAAYLTEAEANGSGDLHVEVIR